MCAGDAGHELQREGGDLGARQRWEDLFIGTWRQEGDERATLGERGDLVGARLAHLHHELWGGGAQRGSVCNQGGARLLVCGVWETCGGPSTALNKDLVACGDQFCRSVGDERHAALP